MQTTLKRDEPGRTSLAKFSKDRVFTVEVDEETGRITLNSAAVVSAQSL